MSQKEETDAVELAGGVSGGGLPAQAMAAGKRLRAKTRVVAAQAAKAAAETAERVKAKAKAVDGDALKARAKDKARAGAKGSSDAVHAKAVQAAAKIKETNFKEKAKAGARGAAGRAKALAKALRHANYSDIAASTADGVQAARLRAKLLVGEEAPERADELKERLLAKKEAGRQALLAKKEQTAEQRARAKELVLHKKAALEEELLTKQAELTGKLNAKLEAMSQKHAVFGAAIGGLGRAGRGLKRLGLRKLGLAREEKPDRSAAEAGWIVNGVWRGRHRPLPPLRCPVLDARAAAGELLHSAARAGDMWCLQRLLRETEVADGAAAGVLARSVGARPAALPDLLTVRVLRATRLLPMDRVTKLTDAFVRVEVAGQSFCTPTRHQTMDPVWDSDLQQQLLQAQASGEGKEEEGKEQGASGGPAASAATGRDHFEFRVSDPDAVLRCCVYHSDPVAHEAIGSFEVSLRSLLPAAPRSAGEDGEGGEGKTGASASTGASAPTGACAATGTAVAPTELTKWFSLSKVRPDDGDLPTLQPGKHLGEPVGAPGWIAAHDDDGGMPASVLAGMEAGQLARNGGGRGRVQIAMQWHASCEAVSQRGGVEEAAGEWRGRGQKHWMREGLDARLERHGLGVRSAGPAWDPADAEVDGATLLHTAAATGRVDVVRMLCEQYGFGRDGPNQGALICPDGSNYDGKADEVEGGANQDTEQGTASAVPPTAPAEGRGRFRSMGRFGRLEARDANGATALFRAAASNHLPAVRYLHEVQGASLDAATHWGETALHRACELAHARVVHYLLSRGAWTQATDCDGLIPADYVGRAARPLWAPRVARRKLASIEAVHALIEARVFVESVVEELLLETLTPEEAALARAEADERNGGRARSRSLVIHHEEDVARGKTATASTNLLDEDGRMNPASHALNGDPASHWATKENCNRATWEVDLKAAHRICRIAIKWRPNKRGFGGDLVFYPRRFTVQVREHPRLPLSPSLPPSSCLLIPLPRLHRCLLCNVLA